MQNGSQSLRRGSSLWPLCLPRLPGMYWFLFYQNLLPLLFLYLLFDLSYFFFFALLSCNWCLVSPILPFIIFLSLYLGSFSCYSFFMCNRPTVKTWYRRKPVDRRKRRQLRLLVQMDQRRALVNLRQEKMVKSPSYSTNARLASIFFFFILGVRICHIPTFLSRFTNVQPV